MVEEEVFEFYQPDDTLRLADIIADSQHPDAATIAEQEELVDRSSEFAFAFDLLKDMPRLWRRIFCFSVWTGWMPAASLKSC